VAIGGGELNGNYRGLVTIGQTVTGIMSGDNIMGLIGFWQPEGVTGIEEPDQFRWENASFQETRLYPPMPNPFARTTRICYTLHIQTPTLVQICDISGRVVRTLVNSVQRPGKYALHWDAKDNSGRTVANGIYLCRFSAGEYRRNLKLVLQR